MDRSAELRRVLEGPLPGAVSEDFLLRTTFTADDPRAVVALARDVMAKVLAFGGDWADIEAWRDLLPPRFTAACAPERDEAAGPPADDAPAAEREAGDARTDWTVSGWVHWLDPEDDMRGWQWWDAGVDGPHAAWVDVRVDGFPFGSGSLEFLLTACGARELDS